MDIGKPVNKSVSYLIGDSIRVIVDGITHRSILSTLEDFTWGIVDKSIMETVSESLIESVDNSVELFLQI
jgi:hypothetical protein